MVKIKPLLVTRSKANASVQTALRKALRQYIIGELAKRKLDDFAKELVGHTFQKGMYNAGSKVYPLSTCEVRWAHVTEEKKPVEKVEEKAEEKAEETEEVKEEIKKETKEVPAEKPKEEAKEEAPAVEEAPAEKPAEVESAETSD
jgi:ribosomal protein S3AE